MAENDAVLMDIDQVDAKNEETAIQPKVEPSSSDSREKKENGIIKTNDHEEIKEGGMEIKKKNGEGNDSGIAPYPRLYRDLEAQEKQFSGIFGEYIFRRLPAWAPALTAKEIESDLTEIKEAVGAKYNRRRKKKSAVSPPVKPRGFYKPSAKKENVVKSAAGRKPAARKKKDDEDKLVPLGKGPKVTATELIQGEYNLHELEAQSQSLKDFAKQRKERAAIDREDRLDLIRHLLIHIDDEYTKMADAWRKMILLGELEVATSVRKMRRRDNGSLATDSNTHHEGREDVLDAFMHAYQGKSPQEEEEDMEKASTNPEAQENGGIETSSADNKKETKIRTSARAQARAKQQEEEKRKQDMKRIKLRLGKEFFSPPTDVPLILSPLSRRPDAVLAADYSLIEHPEEMIDPRLNDPVLQEWEDLRLKALELEGKSRHLDYWMKQHLEMKRSTIDMIQKCVKGHESAQEKLDQVMEEYEELVKERLDREADAAANEAICRSAHDAVAAAFTALGHPVPIYISLEEEERIAADQNQDDSDSDEPMQVDDPGINFKQSSSKDSTAPMSKKRKTPIDDENVAADVKKSRYEKNNNHCYS